jgi:nucleoside diphosphate kinase
MSELPEQSFLLLKPDAIRTDRIGAIVEEVRRNGLDITCSRDLTLTPDDVRQLWREYTPVHHPLTFAFLDRYLCGGVSRVLCVSGENAFELTRRIKRTIRAQFSKGVFANVIHAAETRAELARQKAVLVRTGSHCKIIAIDEDADTILRPSGLPADEIRSGLEAIQEIWDELEKGDGALEEPVPVRLSPEHSEPWGVMFGVDSHNSVDSAVAAVKRSLPELSLVGALRLAIYAGRADGHLIALGDERSARACLVSLRSFGIRNCKLAKLRGASWSA